MSQSRPSLVVGMLPETRNRWERRAPLTPEDVSWLIQRKIIVEVISSPHRILPDRVYREVGAKIVKNPQKANILVGIKEPPVGQLISKSIYCVFSHTTKGQIHNRPLLEEMIRKKITLVDYEHIRDRSGNRMVYFGQYAGICGMIDSLHYLGQRLEAMGLGTPILRIKKSLDYGTFRRAKRHLLQVKKEIQSKGLHPDICPFIIGITGHGNVARGAQEVLDLMGAIEIHPKDIEAFVRRQKTRKTSIYKIVFTREEKLRSKDGGGFYFEEYLQHPERFESNLDEYIPFLNILIHGSYWDKRYPRLVTEKMVRRIFRLKQNKLMLIGDLTCDVKGGIEITHKATSPDHPVYIFDPISGRVSDGIKGRGIAILAVDHLPAEFPEEASQEFGEMIRDYVYQLASHGVTNVTDHHALPVEIRKAVVCQNGKLTESFRYLGKYLNT